MRSANRRESGTNLLRGLVIATGIAVSTAATALVVPTRSRRDEPTVHKPHGSNRGSLICLGGVSLMLASAPSAAAVPALPEGYEPPTEPQSPPLPGASAPERVADLSSSGINWGTVALAVVGIAVLVLTAVVVIARRRRLSRPADQKEDTDMLDPDTETRRHLVREHQADLKRDASHARDMRPRALETRRRRRAMQLMRFRLSLRPAGDPP